MPAGMTILVVVAALIYFGVAQRMLDKMRLTDTQALLFIGLMSHGQLHTIPVVRENQHQPEYWWFLGSPGDSNLPLNTRTPPTRCGAFDCLGGQCSHHFWDCSIHGF